MTLTCASDEAYAEIAVHRVEFLQWEEDIGLRSLYLRGERRFIADQFMDQHLRNKSLLRDGKFNYIGYGIKDDHEWWSTPDGRSVLLSTKRIEAILDGDDDGMPKDTSHLVFHQWRRCEPTLAERASLCNCGQSKAERAGKHPEHDEFCEVLDYVEYDPKEHCSGYEGDRHTRINGMWGHLEVAECGAPLAPANDPMSMSVLDAFDLPAEIREVITRRSCMLPSGHEGDHEWISAREQYDRNVQAFLDSLAAIAQEQLDGYIVREGVPDEIVEVKFTTRINEDGTETLMDGNEDGVRDMFDGSVGPVRLAIPDKDPEHTRVSLDQALPVRDLADGVERVLGFEEALRDRGVGHKRVAEMFPFTTESSVRRWRKAQGVVLS